MWSVWLVFCDCGFHSVCPLRDKDKRLMEASWRDWLWGKLGLVLMGGDKFSKSLIQFSVGCVPSLLFDLRPNCGGGGEDNGDLLPKVSCTHCCTQCSRPWSMPLLTHTSTGDSWTLIGRSALVSCGVTAPFSWVLLCMKFRLSSPSISGRYGVWF